MVDSHKARHHAPISLEETWATSKWTHHVLAFVISIMEVNMLPWQKYVEKQKATTTENDYAFSCFVKCWLFS
jgi:hypothetical protein